MTSEGSNDKLGWLIDLAIFTVGSNLVSRLDGKPEISLPMTISDAVASVLVLAAIWSAYNFLKPIETSPSTDSQQTEPHSTE